MRLLLDTHVAIWAVAQPTRLTAEIRRVLSGADNEVFVSAISILEIAAKFAAKRRSAPPFSAAAAIGYFQGSAFKLLDVRADHALAVERLPLLHSDPFDRLLVAQAISEPLRLVTHDAKLAPYSDTIIVF